MSKKIELDQLTPSQRKQLMKDLQVEQKATADAVRHKRTNYKKDVDESVREIFVELQAASDYLAKTKLLVVQKLKGFISQKSDLYNREDDQTTHTFSTTDGSISITMGYRMQDAWDDTVHVGIGKMKDYLTKSLEKGKVAKEFTSIIFNLLKLDKNGNLDAGRVLDLQKTAEEVNISEFTEAVKIIQEAHNKHRSKEFVSCFYKKDSGEKLQLPLSITDVVLESALR